MATKWILCQQCWLSFYRECLFLYLWSCLAKFNLKFTSIFQPNLGFPAQFHLYLLGSGFHIDPACLLADLEGAKPSAFWMFCLKENPWDQFPIESLKPDGHGAEDVEEDEAAVRHVVPGQITMTDSLELTLFWFLIFFIDCVNNYPEKPKSLTMHLNLSANNI